MRSTIIPFEIEIIIGIEYPTKKNYIFFQLEKNDQNLVALCFHVCIFLRACVLAVSLYSSAPVMPSEYFG